MPLILRVEADRAGSSLWSRPEWLAVLVFVIFGEDAEEIPDGVIVVVIEHFASKFDASSKTVALLHLYEVTDSR